MITLEKLAGYESYYEELNDFEKEAFIGLLRNGLSKLKGTSNTMKILNNPIKTSLRGLNDMAKSSLERSQRVLNQQMSQLRAHNNFLRAKLNEARARKGLSPIMI